MTSEKSRNAVVLFLCGICLSLLNYILIHPILLAVGHLEIGIYVFTLAYFSGISIGYFYSDKIQLKHIHFAIPAFFILQILLVIFLQPLSYLLLAPFKTQDSVNLFLAAAACFLAMLVCGTPLFAVFLPKFISETPDQLRRSYSIEVAGSITGLLLLPLLGSISFRALIIVYILGLCGIAFCLKIKRLSLISLVGLGILVGIFFPKLDQIAATRAYQTMFRNSGPNSIEEVFSIEYTPYHKIEVLQTKSGHFRLMLNGKTQFIDSGKFSYSYFVAEFPARLLGSPKSLALGCGSMITLGRIGNFVTHLDVVDIDEMVCKTSEKYFQHLNHSKELKNWKFTADDAKHFLGNSTEQFDLIYHDIPPARSRQTALTYTKEFFATAKARLSADGIFVISSLHSTSPKKKYAKKIAASLLTTFDRCFALRSGQSYYFYCGGKNLNLPDENKIRTTLIDEYKGVAILTEDQLRKMIEGIEPVTISNVGELIYD